MIIFSKHKRVLIKILLFLLCMLLCLLPLKNTASVTTVLRKASTKTITLSYEYCTIGEECTFRGTLINPETGKPLFTNGKEVIAEKTFIAETEYGLVEFNLIFDSSALKSETFVRFELLSHNEIFDGLTYKINLLRDELMQLRLMLIKIKKG